MWIEIKDELINVDLAKRIRKTEECGDFGIMFENIGIYHFDSEKERNDFFELLKKKMDNVYEVVKV